MLASDTLPVVSDTPKSQVESLNKIRKACAEVKKRGLNWLWVDTCCIDKSDNTELSEALNSMYAWYHEADVCLAYLRDVELPRADLELFETLQCDEDDEGNVKRWKGSVPLTVIYDCNYLTI